MVCSVIAVSGLGGHPLGSWKSRYGPEVWLRDILPLDIPDIRVLLYGYDTDFVASKSKKSILDLALSFLEAVKTVRSDKAVSNLRVFDNNNIFTIDSLNLGHL